MEVLRYGCETWTMMLKDKNYLQTMEMWLWRKMIKTNWVEQKSNENALKGEKRSLIINKMDRKIKWIEHLIHHNDFLNNIIERMKEE